MNERVESIRRSVDAIRKSGTIPHWRMVYADRLLERACDYIAIDREPEAKMMLDKLARWVGAHTPMASGKTYDTRTPMVFWKPDMLRETVRQIRETLARRKMLIPPTERASIQRRLDMVEERISKGKCLDAHAELISLRSTLIARLRRSFRARLVASTDYRGGMLVQPAGSLVGPYNSRHTLEEMFQIVGERDPIWIEDFLDVYNDLFRIAERLVPQEKK